MIGRIMVVLIVAVSVIAAIGGAVYFLQNQGQSQLSMPIKAGTVLHYDKEHIVYAFFSVSNASGGSLIGSWNATAPVWVVFESAGKDWSVANLTSLTAPLHVASYGSYHLYFQKGKYVIAFIMHANVTLTIEQTIQVIE